MPEEISMTIDGEPPAPAARRRLPRGRGLALVGAGAVVLVMGGGAVALAATQSNHTSTTAYGYGSGSGSTEGPGAGGGPGRGGPRDTTPHLDGKVKSVSGTTILITDREGFTRTIVTSSATKYSDSLTASPAVGTQIHASGKVDANGTSLDATAIGKMPTPPAGGPGHGPRGPGGAGGPGSGSKPSGTATPPKPTPAPSTTA